MRRVATALSSLIPQLGMPSLNGSYRHALATPTVPVPHPPGPGDHPRFRYPRRQRDHGRATPARRARAADGVRRGGTARSPAAARGPGPGRGVQLLRSRRRSRLAARGGSLVLGPARPAHRRGRRGLRAGQQGPAVRPDGGHRRRRRRDPPQLGQLRRAGEPGRGHAALRARLIRRTRRGAAGPHRFGGPGRGPPGPFGHPHAARQPDRDAGLPRGRPRRLRGRGGPRPDHHLRRDLPRSRLRQRCRVRQSRFNFSRTNGGHHRPEQEPRPGWLAPGRGPAAGRMARARAAHPAARDRQRDLVRSGRAGPAGGRAGVQRTAPDRRTDRAQPPSARGRRPRGRAPVHRGRGGRARTAGGVLPLPGLHAARGRAAATARHHQRRGPGGAAAARVRGRSAAGLRVRRPGRPGCGCGSRPRCFTATPTPSASPR